MLVCKDMKRKAKKSIYENLISPTQYRAILKAEPYRHATDPEGNRVALGWQPHPEKPGIAFCPLCGTLHGHGWHFTGHRCPHCPLEVANRDGGYYLIPIGRVVPPQIRQAAHSWNKVFNKYLKRLHDPRYRQEKFSPDAALYFAREEYEDQEVNPWTL